MLCMSASYFMVFELNIRIFVVSRTKPVAFFIKHGVSYVSFSTGYPFVNHTAIIFLLPLTWPS